jgi:hypothetical protein
MIIGLNKLDCEAPFCTISLLYLYYTTGVPPRVAADLIWVQTKELLQQTNQLAWFQNLIELNT